MNFLLRLLAVGSLLTSVHMFAASAFEGKVSLAITSEKGQTRPLDYTIKGQKLRMDITADESASGEGGQAARKKSHKLLPGFLGGKPAAPDKDSPPSTTDTGTKHQISTIMDMEKMEMVTLIHEQNMYMVMPIKQAANKAMEHAEKAGDMTDVERTGKTEKILGYTCDQILVTDKDKGTVTELWVAPDLGMFMGLGGGNPMGGGGGMFGARKSNSAAAAKWEEALKGKGGFPLRVISHDAKGKDVFKMEATKIEPGSQPDSLFAPPADYQKFQMPDLGSLFKQG